MHSEVPGVEELVVVESGKDIAAGVSAGYPEFLCRIVVEFDTFACWLFKAERQTLKATLSSGYTIGKAFFAERTPYMD